eukprot:5651621-Pyramimonas_sp.AAC.1
MEGEFADGRDDCAVAIGGDFANGCIGGDAFADDVASEFTGGGGEFTGGEGRLARVEGAFDGAATWSQGSLLRSPLRSPLRSVPLRTGRPRRHDAASSPTLSWPEEEEENPEDPGNPGDPGRGGGSRVGPWPAQHTARRLGHRSRS